MPVLVAGRIMPNLAGVGMGVKMRGGGVPVFMEMNPITNHAVQYIGAEHDQHDTDGGFQNGCDRFRHRGAEQQYNAADRKYGHCMTGPPGEAEAHCLSGTPAVRRQRRHGSHMVRFKGMAHP